MTMPRQRARRRRHGAPVMKVFLNRGAGNFIAKTTPADLGQAETKILLFVPAGCVMIQGSGTRPEWHGLGPGTAVIPADAGIQSRAVRLTMASGIRRNDGTKHTHASVLCVGTMP